MGLMYRFCCTRKREALLSSFAPAYSTSSSTSRASMAYSWVTRIEPKEDDIGIVDHFVPVQLAGILIWTFLDTVWPTPAFYVKFRSTWDSEEIQPPLGHSG